MYYCSSTGPVMDYSLEGGVYRTRVWGRREMTQERLS